MLKRIVIGVLFCGIGFATTVGGIVSTNQQILRVFEMPDYLGAVPENIEAAISQKTPIGSSRRDVEQFLAARGIGKDRGSVCSPKPNDLEIVCQLGIHHRFWELIRETFDLSFTFDSDRKLREISVRSTFSSPL